VVFGDHLADVSNPILNWPAALADCEQYVATTCAFRAMTDMIPD
jgi:hypothetical protein